MISLSTAVVFEDLLNLRHDPPNIQLTLHFVSVQSMMLTARNIMQMDIVTMGVIMLNATGMVWTVKRELQSWPKVLWPPSC